MLFSFAMKINGKNCHEPRSKTGERSRLFAAAPPAGDHVTLCNFSVPACCKGSSRGLHPACFAPGFSHLMAAAPNATFGSHRMISGM